MSYNYIWSILIICREEQVMEEEFLTKKELAALLKVTIKTIDRLCINEGLPFVKFGRNVRFNKKEVLDWVKNSNKQ